MCGGVCVCLSVWDSQGSFTVFGGVMLDLCVGLCDDLRVHGLHACGFVVHSGEEDMRVCGGVCTWSGPQAYRPMFRNSTQSFSIVHGAVRDLILPVSFAPVPS